MKNSILEKLYCDPEQKVYITIDIDWASEEVLDHTITFFEKENVSATFFVTHETPLLQRLRKNSLFELAIHPNFLMISEEKKETAQDIIDRCKRIVPEAITVRSHSLVTSSPLLETFYENGFKYDVNHFIPWNAKIKLHPFYHWNGLIRVPYCYEDDVHCIMIKNNQIHEWDVSNLLNMNGIKVFNFHPIHLFLNTENLNRYEQSRRFHRDIKSLECYRLFDESIGAMSCLRKIIKKAKDKNMIFAKICDIEVGDWVENSDIGKDTAIIRYD